MNQVTNHQQQSVEVRQSSIENEQELQHLLFNPQAMEQLYNLAQTMAQAKITVPKHLVGNVGDCMAICMQAAQWRMNPYAVAQKTHVVNGTLGYEAQLVNAVIQASGFIVGTFHYEYSGQGEALQCRVGAMLKGDTHITWGEWLPLSFVKTRNSPLWATNPKQQLGYLQVKNWGRAYAPSAILGVYSVDELQDYAPKEKEVGYTQPAQAKAALSETVTQHQQQLLINAATVAGVDENYVCQTARINSLSDLQASRFDAALNHLKSLAIQGEGNE